jgi:hypothetical protein
MYIFPYKILKINLSLAPELLCTLKICQVFSWPGLKGKDRVRIWTKSFRIHNTDSATNSSEVERHLDVTI